MIILSQNNCDNFKKISFSSLNIRDDKLSQFVPVVGFSDSKERFVQFVALQNYSLCFQEILDGDWFPSSGFSKVVLTFYFSSSNDSCSIRLLRKDKNGILSVSPIVNVSATSIQSNGKFLGEEKVFNCLGADSLSVKVVSGNVPDIYIAVI